jgi:hypothetical protein
MPVATDSSSVSITTFGKCDNARTHMVVESFSDAANPCSFLAIGVVLVPILDIASTLPLLFEKILSRKNRDQERYLWKISKRNTKQ